MICLEQRTSQDWLEARDDEHYSTSSDRLAVDRSSLAARSDSISHLFFFALSSAAILSL